MEMDIFLTCGVIPRCPPWPQAEAPVTRHMLYSRLCVRRQADSRCTYFNPCQMPSPKPTFIHSIKPYCLWELINKETESKHNLMLSVQQDLPQPYNTLLAIPPASLTIFATQIIFSVRERTVLFACHPTNL